MKEIGAVSWNLPPREMSCQHFQWYEPRDVRVKVKSSKGNPGSTDLISDRLCDMVWI